MKIGASLNYAIVELTTEEQDIINDLIQEQDKAESDEAKLSLKLERKMICNVPWKQLKKLVMNQRDTT